MTGYRGVQCAPAKLCVIRVLRTVVSAVSCGSLKMSVDLKNMDLARAEKNLFCRPLCMRAEDTAENHPH